MVNDLEVIQISVAESKRHRRPGVERSVGGISLGECDRFALGSKHLLGNLVASTREARTLACLPMHAAEGLAETARP